MSLVLYDGGDIFIVELYRVAAQKVLKVDRAQAADADVPVGEREEARQHADRHFFFVEYVDILAHLRACRGWDRKQHRVDCEAFYYRGYFVFRPQNFERRDRHVAQIRIVVYEAYRFERRLVAQQVARDERPGLARADDKRALADGAAPVTADRGQTPQRSNSSHEHKREKDQYEERRARHTYEAEEVIEDDEDRDADAVPLREACIFLNARARPDDVVGFPDEQGAYDYGDERDERMNEAGGVFDSYEEVGEAHGVADKDGSRYTAYVDRHNAAVAHTEPYH